MSMKAANCNNTKKVTRRGRRGFMCHYSPGDTSICVPSDLRSVIVPSSRRRHDRTNNTSLATRDDEHARLVNKAGYFQLLESPPLTTPPPPQNPVVTRRSSSSSSSFSVPPAIKSDKKVTDSLASSKNDGHVFQVVVMRVSLHCQGCACKLKKHLAKMEGVTSFSIELESKRVTVMGNVSPLGVLESISKVKRAEFWPC